MNGLVITLPVWGAQYVQHATRLLLPCLLAPGNLPTLAQANLGSIRLILYTSTADAETLLQAPVVGAARAYADVSIETLGDSVDAAFGMRGGSTAAKECHNFGLQLAHLYDAGFVPLCADELCSNNLGNEIVATFQEGKRALLHLGYRLQPELRALAEQTVNSDGVIDIDAAEISRWHLERMGIPNIIPSPEVDADWTMSYGTRARTAYSAQGFHVPCRFVYPDRPGPIRINWGADQDLAGNALQSMGRCRLLTSSTQLVCAGIEEPTTAPEDPWQDLSASSQRERMVEVMSARGDAFNRAWLGTTFWTEAGDADPAEKTEVEVYQAAQVGRLYAAYRAKYGEP